MIVLGNIYPSGGQAGRVFDVYGFAPTFVTFTGGCGKEPLILIFEKG